MGTSQALIGARALARHLAGADGDHVAALTGYEAELRPYVAENQAKGREDAAAFGGRAEQRPGGYFSSVPSVGRVRPTSGSSPSWARMWSTSPMNRSYTSTPMTPPTSGPTIGIQK